VKIGLALEQVHSAEVELADQLTLVGERHKADHDIYHLTSSLAAKAATRIEQLAAHGARFDVRLDPKADVRRGGPLDLAREKASELLGRRPEAGLMLLADLRELHLAATRASIDWVALGQGAQAVRDADLLALVDGCQPQVEKVTKWSLTRIKTAAPQVLAG
jgi:hypothetical protein